MTKTSTVALTASLSLSLVATPAHADSAEPGPALRGQLARTY